MGYLTDDLVKEKPFEYDIKEKEYGGAFNRALTEELRFHYDNNPMYRRFCEGKGFDPHNWQGDMGSIPPVQVSVFKELGASLRSVPSEDVKLTLRSSATSGVPSSVPVDQITSRRQARAMVKVVGDYIGNERRPFLIMDVDPSSGFREILGARYAAVSGYLNFASEAEYFLKVNEDNTYYFDIDGIGKYIEGLGEQSAVVFGFTYLLYSEVMKPSADKGLSFKLPKGSKVIHIGGWKKLESEKIDREQFCDLAARVFGIDPWDCIDIYGFTEQMGLNYPDCRCGCKHVPLYSEVLVRDLADGKLLEAGQTGALEFITPVPHSYPGCAVLTDDLGMIVPGECPYGRAGTRFKVVGRLKKAEVRGCGDILSSKLRFTDDNAQGSAAAKASDGTEGIKIYYIHPVETRERTSPEVIDELADTLRSRLEWLRSQPVDALIGLISKAAEKWNAAGTDQGMEYLQRWCRSGELIRTANDGLRGNRHYADAFLTKDDSGVELMKATSRGLVCHYLAGNVKALGMYVLIQSILAKNVNLLRVSSRDNGMFWSLLSAFRGVTYETPGGFRISGDDLLETVAVCYYDHSDREAGRRMSAIADARIAWGGSEAVTTVASYPSSYRCVDIIMGPKLSMSVISREALSDERKASKLARRVAVDASVFDQSGCASTHNVFVEKGGVISPGAFAEMLARGMSKVAAQIPKEAMTPGEYAAVHSIRGIYDFKGKVYGDGDSVWTVLYDEDNALNPPVYSRVVFVHGIDDMNDVLEHVSDDIQTIGLGATGERAYRFATQAADRGAERFPACGRMLNFESPWDGMFIMDRLVRWNTLGGPR